MPKTKKILKNDDLSGESVKKTILELTVVLTENNASVSEDLEGLFAKHQINVLEKKDWGSKFFSRPIKKQPQGHYLFFLIEIPIHNLLTFEKDLMIKEGVLRYFKIKASTSSKNPSRILRAEVKKGKRG